MPLQNNKPYLNLDDKEITKFSALPEIWREKHGRFKSLDNINVYGSIIVQIICGGPV